MAALELWAYGDESGIHGTAQYCLLLGYVGAPRQWSSFKNRWRDAPQERGISEFHAIDFFQGRKVYRDWPGDKRRLLLDTLLAIIASHRIVPIGWAVDIRAFKALRPDERRFFTGAHIETHTRANRVDGYNQFEVHLRRRFTTSGAQSQPYLVAFNQFLYDCFRISANHALLHVVFDRQNVLESGSIQMFHERWKGGGFPGGKEFASITYADSANEPPLQAADLYAYAWGRCLNNAPTENVRHAMSSLTARKRKLPVADADYFEEELTKLRQGLREDAFLFPNAPVDDLEQRL